jgi:endo-1,4-beta-xylanase
MGALATANKLAPASNLANQAAQPANADSLKNHAARRGLLYGAATHDSYLSSDARFADTFAQQCGILVPEGELKWNVLRPTRDSYDFAPADWLCNFTQRHHMKFRGHTLAWSQAVPKWLDAYITKANAKQLLVDHIANVLGHYAGKMHSWDVINEALKPSDRRPDGLRTNGPWMQCIGPEYIEIAFHAAAAADPHSLLVWNENMIEEETQSAEARRQFLVQHLKTLQKRKVPVQAIGIQSHLVANRSIIAGAGFQRFLREVSEMGLKILITELDVTDSALPPDTAIRDRAIAEIYYNYLSTVLQHKSVSVVLTWGLTNRHSWLATYNPRDDRAHVRPLPFDADLNRTPAWSAMARAFDNAPQR